MRGRHMRSRRLGDDADTPPCGDAWSVTCAVVATRGVDNLYHRKQEIHTLGAGHTIHTSDA